MREVVKMAKQKLVLLAFTLKTELRFNKAECKIMVVRFYGVLQKQIFLFSP